MRKIKLSQKHGLKNYWRKVEDGRTNNLCQYELKRRTKLKSGQFIEIVKEMQYNKNINLVEKISNIK